MRDSLLADSINSDEVGVAVATQSPTTARSSPDSLPLPDALKVNTDQRALLISLPPSPAMSISVIGYKGR